MVQIRHILIFFSLLRSVFFPIEISRATQIGPEGHKWPAGQLLVIAALELAVTHPCMHHVTQRHVCDAVADVT